jgi:hypothetical protein
MATIMNNNEISESQIEMYELVHPLYDAPEVKRSAEGLGPMAMQLGVKLSLFALRAYLIIMILLVFYSVLHQAGVFGH